jgi:hypothetical protein
MGGTVWTSGCQSWYLDADGDPLSWPYSWQQWKREMAAPEMTDFATASFKTDDSEVESAVNLKLAYAQA